MLRKPVRSVVLSGGGARGAYEAGVLAYILNELPRELLQKSPLNIFCGTSVGAIHACFLAANAHLPGHDIQAMLRFWQDLHFEKLLRFNLRDLLRLPRDVRELFGGSELQKGLFINTQVLKDIVTRDINWANLRNNVQCGRVQAVTVSATHISSGKTVVFIDRLDGVPSWTRDARRIARAAHIGPQHALASAAIPLLFPAVALDGAYYCDGGLRQNTPLSPALRCGADRVLVIPVGHGRDAPVPQTATEPEQYPGPSLLVGKVFNALLLDHLDYDLAQLRGFNRVLNDGRAAFGDSFLHEISKTAERIRGASYRHVDTVVVRPSRDLGEMAMDFVDAAASRLGSVTAWLLRQVASADALNNSDLLSYLCFDGGFASALIELGMADADAARAQLTEFFQD